MHLLRYFLISAVVASTGLRAQQSPVIPHPDMLSLAADEITLPQGRVSVSTKEISPEAEFLRRAFASMGVSRTPRTDLEIDAKRIKSAEGYALDVNEKGVSITGGSRAGVFYGIQTLLQDYADNGRVRRGLTMDAPRYAWRGIMIDEARHFFGEKKMKQIIDLMAYYKLNRLHWHLTDEQAWRIEIKRYPRLTEVGGKGSWSEPLKQEAEYYTQEQIREIVAYASARHIEIIPEIDMPGHATAANRAYIGLSGGGTKAHPHFTFNPGRDSVYSFLTHVLREVTTLFPTQYLHLGGDEVAFGIEAWKTDPDVKALMQREGMTDVKQAEAYFMRRMADSVRTMGKILAGWDELLDLDVNPEQALIMWWRHDRDNYLKRSLNGGYTTVLCPRRPLYFDFVQHASHKWGRVWNGFCPLEDVFAFPDVDFARRKVTRQQQKGIAGVQANVWTERIHTNQRLDFMLFPRLCAVAEAGWTQPENKDYGDFIRRMEHAYRFFDSLGIYYFDPRSPQHHPEPEGATRSDKDVPFDFRD